MQLMIILLNRTILLIILSPVSFACICFRLDRMFTGGNTCRSDHVCVQIWVVTLSLLTLVVSIGLKCHPAQWHPDIPPTFFNLFYILFHLFRTHRLVIIVSFSELWLWGQLKADFKKNLMARKLQTLMSTELRTYLVSHWKVVHSGCRKCFFYPTFYNTWRYERYCLFISAAMSQWDKELDVITR